MNKNSKKNSNVPNLRFPEFSGEWEERKLGDILTFFSTNSLSWDQLEYGKGNIYNLHYGLIHKGLPTQIELDKFSLPSIKKEFIPKNYTLCKEGDISFADASEDTNDVGKVVEFLDCNNKKVICGLHTIHARDNDNLTIIGFKGYAFSSIVFKNQIRRLSQGTKVFSISVKNFNEIFIGIPSHKEQKKIATLLKCIDERIQTQNKIIEQYKSLIKGLQDIIFEILTSSGGQSVRFYELYSKAGEGGTPDTTKREYYNKGNIPFIKIDDLSNKYLTNNRDYITELGLKKSSAWMIPSNSVLYSNGATIGVVSINHYPVATKQGILGIVPTKQVDTEYLYYLLKTTYFKKEITRIITRGTMMTAYLKDINSIKCPLPSISTQKQITSVLSNLSNKITIEEQYLIQLETQKKYLLQQMFI